VSATNDENTTATAATTTVGMQIAQHDDRRCMHTPTTATSRLRKPSNFEKRRMC
jgi:hypothetical protein